MESKASVKEAEYLEVWRAWSEAFLCSYGRASSPFNSKCREKMSQIQYIDELIREYLLYRGFGGTLKVFDSELKVDKDKGFRVDKILDQLMQYIFSYDLVSLKELWTHLDHKMFSKLEHHFAPAVRKMENAVLKLYLVNAVTNNKPDKVVDFFNKYTVELQGQPEWKEWFMLPFVKNPEENPSFAVHFTRQWQDTLCVSLHNFLATIFQCMPQPTLTSFEEDALRMKRLQEENEALKQRFVALMENSRSVPVSDIIAPEVPPPAQLMDDFYIIALDEEIKFEEVYPHLYGRRVENHFGKINLRTPDWDSKPHIPVISRLVYCKSDALRPYGHRNGESTTSTGESQAKTLKNLIRNIGSGSPGIPRKASQSAAGQDTRSSKMKSSNSPNVEEQQQKKSTSSKQRLNSNSWTSAKPSTVSLALLTAAAADVHRDCPPMVPRDESLERRASAGKHLVSAGTSCDIPASAASSTAFLLLSQDVFNDHRAAICQCKFNTSGSSVISCDTDGVIKLWNTSPTPKTQATFVSKSSVLSVDWVSKNERYLVAGNKAGLVRLYDTHDNRIMWELGAESNSPLKDNRIVHVCCNPMESTFICSAANNQGEGKLLLYNIKTKKLERSLFLNTGAAMANCCAFNHNGQLLVAGCSDGSVRIFDLRRSDCIDSWSAHQGNVLSIKLTDDFTSCYTLGQDTKMCQRSLNQRGNSVWEAELPDCQEIFSNLETPHSQLFTFDPSGSYVLTCGYAGGSIYQLSPRSLTSILNLGGHRAPALAVDWTFANQCATCVTASSDGKVRVSTLLAP
uniref:WD repeat-containing protein 91 n=2 Tax=Timema TaxID=61471 RepID=A0A7R9CZ77_TIMCR|nr:unnamed protein product [Timema cristinae]